MSVKLSSLSGIFKTEDIFRFHRWSTGNVWVKYTSQKEEEILDAKTMPQSTSVILKLTFEREGSIGSEPFMKMILMCKNLITL